MKSYTIPLVIGVTGFLVLFVSLIQMNLDFGFLFYMMIVGQLLVIFMTWKVLTDTYTTDKTFDNWYEDSPKESEE
ncbi:hypothetical protein [Robertkochia aurantiaca]|uniref:hypothetical protein n=1 Tax=Robertkochia aurantiaca TaxID=2873700 RepID=UPI001CCC8123|nr:hypothetical protein [Robertkochia sp. 3YJGBD-33]